MNLILERGNQILNLDNVCAASYKIFSKDDEKMIGYSSILYVFTNDGKETVFKNKDANAVYKWLSERAIQIPD